MKKHIQIHQIINCVFEYRCPLDWDLLDNTKDPFVKFCKECQKFVQLCTNDEQIDLAWQKGQCVAHPMYTPELLEKITAYESGTGPWPFKEINMPVGLPGPRNC